MSSIYEDEKYWCDVTPSHVTTGGISFSDVKEEKYWFHHGRVHKDLERSVPEYEGESS